MKQKENTYLIIWRNSGTKTQSRKSFVTETNKQINRSHICVYYWLIMVGFWQRCEEKASLVYPSVHISKGKAPILFAFHKC